MIRALLLSLPAMVVAPALAPVLAQVSVNHGALDQLQPAAAAPARPQAGKAPAVKLPARPAAVPRTSAPTTRAPSTPPPKPKPKPRPVVVAPAPPPVAVLPPPVGLPKPVSVPPPPVPIVADAAGEVLVVNGGVRITFGAGKADLNQTTANGIIAVARQVKADPNADLTVFAYAAGVPDDPSTPRRLSLSRALAARAVLISEGIASTRIYVRALGGAPNEILPDRVDIVRAGLPAPDAKP